MADEYCSTPARALSLVLPPPGRARTQLWAERTATSAHGQRLTDNQRALLERLPGPGGRRPRRAAAAGGARPGADRAARARRRVPRTNAAADRSGRADAGPGGGASPRCAAARRARCCTASPARARPRSTCARAPSARRRPRRDRARARDRADAADRRALPGPLRRHRRAAALRAVGGRALRRVAAAALRRGADRGRPALGRVRAGAATSAWSSSTRSTTAPTSTRATRATTPATSPPSAPGAPGRALLVGSRHAAARDVAGARRTCGCRHRVDGAPAAARRDPRHARAPSTRCTRAPRRALQASAQVDRAAQPPRLVELPHLPLVREGLGVPAVRRRARAAPRRARDRLPPLRPSRARAAALRRLRLAVGRPPRLRHRAARARAGRRARRCRCSGSTPTRPRPRTPSRSCSAASTPRPRACCSARRWSPRATTSPTSRSASCSTPTARCASPTSAPRSARSR